MRLLTVILAVVALAVAGTTMAADVPSSTLGQMGIQGMQTVSDAEGMAIRGKALPQSNVLNHLRAFIHASVQDNIVTVRDQTMQQLQGTSSQSNLADLTGLHNTYQAGWLQATLDQVNMIDDAGHSQLHLKNVAQDNVIQAVGGDGYAPGDVGPTVVIDQINALRTTGTAVIVHGGREVVQSNLANVQTALNRQVLSDQLNSIMGARSALNSVQRNTLIVTP